MMNLGMDLLGRTVAPPLLRLRGHGRPRWLPVLAYHRVAALPGPDFALDPGVIDCDPAEFDRQMGMLAARCNPIGLDDLLRFLRGEAPLPPNPVMVTFDDGYRDNHDLALPVLSRHRIPAVFFVASAFVQRRAVFWWDRVAYLLRSARVESAAIRYPTDLVLDPRSVQSRRTLLRLIKTRPGLDIERFLDQLARALGVAWSPALERHLADQLIMTWDQVRAVRAAGMEIGSHTRSHRIIPTLDPGELAGELAGSRADIEREIGAPVRAVSYPAGRTLRPLPVLRRAVEDAGYQVGFTTEGRANRLADPIDPFDISRLALDPGVSTERLQLMLAAPELYSEW